MNSDAAIDLECLGKMKALLQNSYAEVLNDFNRDTQIYIDEIGKALNEDNRNGAAKNAHKIKSSAGQFGFRHLERLARILDNPGELPTGELLKSYSELKDAYKQVGTFLKTQLAS